MPRPGNTDEEMQPLHPPRRQAFAYPGDSRTRSAAVFVLIFLFIVWILPNFFLHDYRQEAMESLRNSGKSAEEIERWFPKTLREKRQENAETFLSLQKEIDELKERLTAIEKFVNMPNRTSES